MNQIKLDKLLRKYLKKFQTQLRLDHVEINLYICRSDDKAKLKKFKLAKWMMNDAFAVSCICNSKCDVIIYSNRGSSRKEFISTLFHELLHVKLFPLVKLIKTSYKVTYDIEEQIVNDLETFYSRMIV